METDCRPEEKGIPGPPDRCPLISLGLLPSGSYHPPGMTRSSIEIAIKIFVVALIATFALTVYKVLAMLGWL